MFQHKFELGQVDQSEIKKTLQNSQKRAQLNQKVKHWL